MFVRAWLQLPATQVAFAALLWDDKFPVEKTQTFSSSSQKKLNDKFKIKVLFPSTKGTLMLPQDGCFGLNLWGILAVLAILCWKKKWKFSRRNCNTVGNYWHGTEEIISCSFDSKDFLFLEWRRRDLCSSRGKHGIKINKCIEEHLVLK